jgi:hypothetical protein
MGVCRRLKVSGDIEGLTLTLKFNFSSFAPANELKKAMVGSIA